MNMETIFKKITKLNDKVFAEKNRDILLSDYVQKTQPKADVTDSYRTLSINSKGKIVSMFCNYEMKYEAITELIEYFKMVSKDGEESTKNNFGEFQLCRRIEIDFRGCKTQKQKDDKVNKTITEIQDEFNQKLELALKVKINKLNENLNHFIDYNNNQFVSNAISIITNPKVYEDEFVKDDEFSELNAEYTEIVAQINILKKTESDLEVRLTEKKRNIALNVLEREKWEIEFETGSKTILPEAVIEKTKQAISKAFFYEHGLFH